MSKEGDVVCYTSFSFLFFEREFSGNYTFIRLNKVNHHNIHINDNYKKTISWDYSSFFSFRDASSNERLGAIRQYVAGH